MHDIYHEKMNQTNESYRQWYCPVHSGTLYCRTHGEAGQTVLLVHEACVDADYFSRTAQVLSQWYQVVTFDRRGYGRNRVSEGRSLKMQQEDIHILTERIGPCRIVAHSAGCDPVMRYLETKPALVQGCLLYEPFLPDLAAEDTVFNRLMQSVLRSLSLHHFYQAALSVLEILGPREKDAPPATAEEIAHLMKNYRVFLSRELIPLLHSHPHYEKLAGLTDVWIGIGENSSTLITGKMAQELARRTALPLVILPGSHHGVYDQPAEFARAVRDLFRTQEGRAGK